MWVITTSINSKAMETIEYSEFEKVELRVGTIIEVEYFPEARVPAYKLTIDFGELIGVKRSSSQVTDYYTKENLLGKQVIAVVNFQPKQVGKFMSEVLTTGLYDEVGKVVLVSPDRSVPNGSKLL
jgi:tRNA-binding protein